MEKILHIPNYYKPHIGGIEQTCHDIVDSLQGVYEQQVLCFSEDKTTKHETIDGVRTTKCGVWKKILSQSISFSYKKEMKRIICEFKPDIVIFHYPNPFVSHYLLKYLKKKKIQLIVWYHMDIVKQKVIRKFFELQTKKLLKLASKIVCTSPIYQQKSKNLLMFKDKVSVIPSCINEERLVLSPDDLKQSELLKGQYQDKIIVFCFGRHVKYKGITYLVEAAQYLTDEYAVLIGGEGPLTEDLKKQASNDFKIHFLGKISDSQLKAYLNIMDIYAFPSITKNEAFGLSLAEGMYFSHPAITFTIEGSGVNYVSLNQQTGIEVENKNAKQFAEAIMELGKNVELRTKYGKAAQKRVQDNFLLKQFKESVQNLLKS